MNEEKSHEISTGVSTTLKFVSEIQLMEVSACINAFLDDYFGDSQNIDEVYKRLARLEELVEADKKPKIEVTE